jgi:hypothetical protein
LNICYDEQINIHSSPRDSIVRGKESSSEDDVSKSKSKSIERKKRKIDAQK